MEQTLHTSILIIYLFIYFSLILTITQEILFTTKNSNKMQIDVNSLVKKPTEHKKLYIKK